MIFLSALRVVSSKNEAEGVNALMYDTTRPVARGEDGRIDLRNSIASNLGPPTRASTAIRPGGNRVRTYLDIVLVDASEALLREAIEAISADIEATPPPNAVSRDRFAVEFNTELGLYAAAPRDVTELGDRLAALLRDDAGVWSSTRLPLVVNVEQDPEAVRFSLDEQSARRVAAGREGAWRAPRIRFEHAVFQDFEAMLPDTWAEIARMLTGLTTDRLLDLGGVRYDLVHRGTTSRTLLEWPERSPAGSR